MKKINESQKKPQLNKKTISNLSKGDLIKAKAGIQDGCWENLYTIYHCDVIWTN